MKSFLPLREMQLMTALVASILTLIRSRYCNDAATRGSSQSKKKYPEKKNMVTTRIDYFIVSAECVSKVSSRTLTLATLAFHEY
jgi:hypothetical protein